MQIWHFLFKNFLFKKKRFQTRDIIFQISTWILKRFLWKISPKGFLWNFSKNFYEKFLNEKKKISTKRFLRKISMKNFYEKFLWKISMKNFYEKFLWKISIKYMFNFYKKFLQKDFYKKFLWKISKINEKNFYENFRLNLRKK